MLASIAAFGVAGCFLVSCSRSAVVVGDNRFVTNLNRYLC